MWSWQNNPKQHALPHVICSDEIVKTLVIIIYPNVVEFSHCKECLSSPSIPTLLRSHLRNHGCSPNLEALHRPSEIAFLLMHKDPHRGNFAHDSVEFRNIGFAYPSWSESNIFHNFCLTIATSKTIYLLVGSGPGKSTTMASIERFYDSLNWEIVCDGVNIKVLQLKWLHSQIGFVS